MSVQPFQTAQNANFLKMSALSSVRKERKGSKNGLSETTLTLTPCSLWKKNRRNKMKTILKDLKISEASFFPEPNEMFKENKTFSNEYCKIWTFNGLSVIASVRIMADGLEWLHVSFSRARKMPTYTDLQLVKRNFIGADKKAIMIFPEQENYVNLHPNCLHLWYSAQNPIPEFSMGLGTI